MSNFNKNDIAKIIEQIKDGTPLKDIMKTYNLSNKEMEKIIDKMEDEELSKRYGNRLETPDEEWIELPPGVSVVDFYLQRKKRKET